MRHGKKGNIDTALSDCLAMHRRSFLSILLSALMLTPHVRAAKSAEAATAGLGLPAQGALDAQVRQRLAARLAQEGFVTTGDTRRKGQFVILEATRAGTTWRLVLDGNTGEIVGRRPLGQLISLQN
ncbi:MAG: hypothetical protein ACRCWF_18770 [Beijerinckiaceae bacterium]